MSESWLDKLLYAQTRPTKEEREKEQIKFWKLLLKDGGRNE